MALSAASTLKFSPRGSIGWTESYDVKNGATVYWGALVVIEMNVASTGIQGRIKPLDDTSGTDDFFVGVARPTGDQVNTTNYDGVTGASAAKPCTVDVSGCKLLYVGVTGASSAVKVGQPVYASADDTLTLTAASYLHAVGRVVKWYTSTYCDVQLYSAMEYAAMIDSD